MIDQHLGRGLWRAMVVIPLTVIVLLAGLAGLAGMAAAADKTEIATFGSGCFWCTESDFDKVPGVLETVSGFMGGHVANPTYRQVTSGRTGHTEVVQVTFDPSKVTYAELVEYYWRHVDPFDKAGQFCDRGSQYRPAIFTHSDEQNLIAKTSRRAIDKSGKFPQKIVVEITPASAFTAAEGYHQDFYKKNPAHYWSYRLGCRRDQRIEQIWGKPAKS
jgi:peptide-methionine (S)-S-oxide reductase